MKMGTDNKITRVEVSSFLILLFKAYPEFLNFHSIDVSYWHIDNSLLRAFFLSIITASWSLSIRCQKHPCPSCDNQNASTHCQMSPVGEDKEMGTKLNYWNQISAMSYFLTVVSLNSHICMMLTLKRYIFNFMWDIVSQGTKKRLSKSSVH